MLKRIIACLDIDGRQVVKGTRYENHINFGDPVALASRYTQEGADEIVVYDIKASIEKRTPYTEVITAISQSIDVPLCVAGGIRNLDHARQVLKAGADKVSINTAALENPELIKEMAAEFGTQCVVVGIDARLTKEKINSYELLYYSGDLNKSKKSIMTLEEWITRAQDLGAGEIVLNSIDRDGTKEGYDLNMLQYAQKKIEVPFIASSGAGSMEDFKNVFTKTSVDGALAAGVFHRHEIFIANLKQYLVQSQIDVRI